MGVFALACEAVSVLHVGLYAVGVELVVGSHRVDHLQVCSRVRHVVACRVAHLILYRPFLYPFALEG